MELTKIIVCSCIAIILLMDVIVASPVRTRDLVLEAERLENAIEEGLSIYRAERNAEKKRSRRRRRRTNLLIEAIRMCRNYRTFPIEHVPARCRNLINRNSPRPQTGSGATIVIIEK